MTPGCETSQKLNVEVLGDRRLDGEELLRRSVRANVRASANQLRQGSKILEDLIRDDGLVIVGAVRTPIGAVSSWR